MSSRLGDKEKKALIIVVAVVIVVALATAGAVTAFMKSDKGKEVSHNADSQFSAVELPEDSSQLTAVQDAPVGRQDKDDDKNQNVDLLGNPVNHSDMHNHRDKRGRHNHSNHDKGPSAQEMKQVSNTGKRVKIPSLHADFALGSLEVPKNNKKLDPTNFTSVFWVKNRGVKYDKTSHGTSYLIAHSLDISPDGRALSGLAPGNWLYDPMTRKSKLNPGDIIEVGGVKFKFEKSRRVGKDLVSQDKNLWNEKKPNRLVFITCMHSSNDNYIDEFSKA